MMLTGENQHQFTEQNSITREDLNIEFEVKSFVNKIVHFNQSVRQGVRFFEMCFMKLTTMIESM